MKGNQCDQEYDLRQKNLFQLQVTTTKTQVRFSYLERKVCVSLIFSSGE